jgi:hypothetical protein
MSEALAYQRKMEALLSEWPGKISFMESRTSVIAPDRRAVYEGLLKTMREKLDETVRLLEESRARGHEGADEGRQRIERSWYELANAYEKALCQFEGVKN